MVIEVTDDVSSGWHHCVTYWSMVGDLLQSVGSESFQQLWVDNSVSQAIRTYRHSSSFENILDYQHVIYFPQRLQWALSIPAFADTPGTHCSLCQQDCTLSKATCQTEIFFYLFLWFCFGEVLVFCCFFFFFTSCQHLGYNSCDSGQADKKGKPFKSTNLEQERKSPNREFSFS